MDVKSIFYNTDERRIRSGYRIIIQFALFSIVINALGFSTSFLSEFIPRDPFNNSSSSLITLFLVVATLVSTFIVGKYLDKRNLTDFGVFNTKNWWIDFSFGLSLGIILMGIIFVTEYFLGFVEITGYFGTTIEDSNFLYLFLFAIFQFLCVGFYEEYLMRGFLFKNLSEGFYNPKVNPQNAIIITLLVSSFIFGFSHAVNPNATLISSLSISLAGIFLAVGYITTGSLAIPIGLHITWNLFQGNIFGFSVSGNVSQVSVININQIGPEIWTGGAFGPESGLIGILIYFIGFC